jgi:hypothetical protein
MYSGSDRMLAQMNNNKMPLAGLLLSLFMFRVIGIAWSNLAFSRFFSQNQNIGLNKISNITPSSASVEFDDAR